MRVCQPIEKDQGMDNVLHGHFRSAPRFLVFDTDKKESLSFDNVCNKEDHDICKTPKLLEDMQVDVAIVGGISRCGFLKLHILGIRVFQAIGQTSEINLDAFQKGKLKELTVENTRRGYNC
jgi:predicted Fe-Mo cluster-binding NifX family protein